MIQELASCNVFLETENNKIFRIKIKLFVCVKCHYKTVPRVGVGGGRDNDPIVIIAVSKINKPVHAKITI